jgi:hypothetical protein
MAQVATPEVVAPAAAVEASDEGGAAPVSPPTSLPVAWQKAGLTERPRDTHSAPRPEEDAATGATAQPKATGRWTAEEHDEFLKCLDVRLDAAATTSRAAAARARAVQRRARDVASRYADAAVAVAQSHLRLLGNVGPAPRQARPPALAIAERLAGGRRVDGRCAPRQAQGGAFAEAGGEEAHYS